MNLLCQGAGGLWTGLGWVTPDWVDKLLLGHTVRQEWVGGVDRSLSGQHQRCVSRLIGSLGWSCRASFVWPLLSLRVRFLGRSVQPQG